MYNENQPRSSRQVFFSRPTFVHWQRKVGMRVSLYHLNVLTFALGCLVQVCEYSVLPHFIKNSHLIVTAILWKFCKWKMQRNQN